MQVGQRVRSLNDGQIGYIVERPASEGGGLGVRLDRRAQTIVQPYSKHKWAVEERSPLTPIHIARVAYQADCALRSARGEFGLKDWPAMKEELRIAWIEGPPSGADDERRRLYAAVVGALKA